MILDGFVKLGGYDANQQLVVDVVGCLHFLLLSIDTQIIWHPHEPQQHSPRDQRTASQQAKWVLPRSMGRATSSYQQLPQPWKATGKLLGSIGKALGKLLTKALGKLHRGVWCQPQVLCQPEPRFQCVITSWQCFRCAQVSLIYTGWSWVSNHDIIDLIFPYLKVCC